MVRLYNRFVVAEGKNRDLLPVGENERLYRKGEGSALLTVA